MRTSRRAWPAAVLAVALALAAPAASAQTPPADGGPALRVMTYSAGEGSDYRPLYFAVEPQDHLDAAAEVLREARATQPHARMRTLAAHIAAAAPALVSLQELNRWSVGAANASPRGHVCAPLRVQMDMLAALLRALRALGTPYRVAAQAPQFKLPPLLAQLAPDRLGCVQVLNRNVILARADLPPSRLRWSNPQWGRLDGPAEGPAAVGARKRARVGGFPRERAWLSVDVRVQGRVLRFMGGQLAHLDPFDPDERRFDGELLRAIADASPMPVVLALAANTRAAPAPPDDTYVDFLAAGYVDAWAQAQPGQTGATCCQAPSMDNAESLLSQRTDLVWLRGAVRARRAALAGDAADGRTPGGLWPSDHAGVVVDLVLEDER
jgi:hypothetical protein